MAVSIDTVYQKVLAFANKEQRGYITPQEFNLFARQAQDEIFEQYFYDLNQAHRGVGNNTTHADVDDMLEEKMQIFERFDSNGVTASYAVSGTSRVLPDYIYRVSRIEMGIGVACDILSTKDYRDCETGGPLTQPTTSRPIANIRGNLLTTSSTTNVGIFYFRKPKPPNWAYVVVNGKTLYNDNISDDFELHASEQSELVYRILAYAGISIQKPELTQFAGQSLGSQIQQEKQ